MNERIEKFARECGAWNQVYADRTFMIDEHFDIEKFAQLIVQECLNQCYNRGMNDELYAGQLKAASYIEQHFGVE